MGELGLDGQLRSVCGVLPAVAAAAAAGFRKVAVPEASAQEATLVPEMAVVGAPALSALLAWLRGDRDAGRAVSDIILLRAIGATGGDAQVAVDFLPQFMAIVHGCASLNQVGLFNDLDSAADVAADTVCRLVAARASASNSGAVGG